jgi:hypothetical protein
VSRASPSQGHEPESPPAAIPAAELCHLPVDSPLPTPSGRIEPTLDSPASARAKPPSLGPRTGPPAANRRRAHRRPALLPRSASSPTPSGRNAVSSPPSALADKWARSDTVVLAHPRRLPLLVGRSWAVSAPARALALGWAKNPPPAQQRRDLFFFFFFHLFLI